MLAQVSEELDYLSHVASDLGVPDPVCDCAPESAGRWEEMFSAARLWRSTAGRVENASRNADGKLGGIDASWEGTGADAFLAHMKRVSATSNDLVDGMRALAEVLERTAEALRTIQADLRDVIAEGAESVAEALRLPDGEQAARDRIAGISRHVRELTASIQDAMRAFSRFCAELEGISQPVEPLLDTASGAPKSPVAVQQPAGGASGAAATTSASADSSESKTDSAEPAAASGTAAVATAGGATAGAAGMGMMPMGMMGGMGGQNAQPRQNGSRFKASPEELFGAQQAGAPEVFGAELEPEPEKDEEERPSSTE